MAEAPRTTAERLAVLETTVKLGFDHLNKRLDALATELSDQGKTPAPVSPKASGAYRVPMPETLMGYAKVLAVYLPLLGTAYAILRSGAQSGGAIGAAQAVEAAVQLGEAVPVSAPAPVRVVPYPLPVPVPIPAPVEDPPLPSDLLPDPR